MIIFGSPTIEAHDLMHIVSRAWYKSSARVESNKKTIDKRGWYTYNRNLMTYSIIRSSITKETVVEERSLSSKITLPLHKCVEITDLFESLSQLINPQYASRPFNDYRKMVNFLSGKATFCLDKIGMNYGLQEACLRTKRSCDEEKTIEETLPKLCISYTKKMSKQLKMRGRRKNQLQS